MAAEIQDLTTTTFLLIKQKQTVEPHLSWEYYFISGCFHKSPRDKIRADLFIYSKLEEQRHVEQRQSPVMT